ncbi:MAG TPA: S8 family serine peptidase [Albitalea sp.]
MMLLRRCRRPFGAARAIAAGLLSLGALHAAHAAPEMPGEVLLKLRTSAALQPLLAKHQLVLVGRLGARPIYRLKVVGMRTTRDAIAALSVESDVLVAEPNLVVRVPEAHKNGAWAIGTPTDYVMQWAPVALRLPEAHLRSTGSGTRVAVLDTGVDTLHPALAGRLLPGYDFVQRDADPSETGTLLDPAFGHGTHVAGLVALVAPDARIMPLRVLDAAGLGNAWTIAEAAVYAADPDANPATDDGAHVINMSLGSTEPTRIVEMINMLVSCMVFSVTGDATLDVSDVGYTTDRERCGAAAGPVVVAAAGNDASDAVPQYPAAEGGERLLAVAASNAQGQLASFSNFGAWVSLAAPGEGVTSTVPGGGYGTWSGTSMASPLAAGVAALLRAGEPALAPGDVARRLLQTTARLCGSELRQLDAAAALANQPGADRLCP